MDASSPSLRRSLIAIGRKDYAVRAVHPAFGEQWNVSWSQLSKLSALDVHRSNMNDDDDDDIYEKERMSSMQFLVGPDFSLRKFDPENSWEVWVQKFDAPPLVAYPSDASSPIDLLGGNPSSSSADEKKKKFNSGGGGAGGGGDDNFQVKHVIGKVLPSSPSSSEDAHTRDGSRGGDGDDRVYDGTLVLGVMHGGLYGIKSSQFSYFKAVDQCSAAQQGDSPSDSTDGGDNSGAGVCAPGADGFRDRDGHGRGTALAAAVPALVSSNNVNEDKGSTALAIKSHAWMSHVTTCRSENHDTCAVSLGVFPLENNQDGSDGGSTRPIGSTMLYLPAGSGSAPKKKEGKSSMQKEERASDRRASAEGFFTSSSSLVWWISVAGTSIATVTLIQFIISPSKDSFFLKNSFLSRIIASLLPASMHKQQPKRQQQQRSNKSDSNVTATTTQQLPGSKKSKKSRAANSTATSSHQKSNSKVNGNDSTAAAADTPLQNTFNNNNNSAQGTKQQRLQQEDGSVRIGRLRVGPGILGYGSGGTIVFEGELDGRSVAVKRLLQQFNELAKKEIGALIVSDEHPNVVRCFAMEEDNEFIYLALEKCVGTLADAVSTQEGRRKFVGPDGTPTEYALQVARDVGLGLGALHSQGIVHRDLKPHNVLLTESGRAKLSDMGLSKRLVSEQASFETAGAGGSPGWQAPEQLIVRAGGSARQSVAVDAFSFGLLLHFCVTGGRHPYGEGFERDAAIMQGRRSFSAVEHMPEVHDVLQGLLAQHPEKRPRVESVMSHPLWWASDQRLAFLIDVSDRIEGEDRAEDVTLYASLEALSPEVVGKEGSWAIKLDSGLIHNLGKYRRYDFASLRDLLRVIRNKHSHFREMPSELQERLGPIPDGFLSYFSLRFPRLLCMCFYFALHWCNEEHMFQKYFSANSSALLATLAPDVIRDPEAAAAALAAVKTRLQSNEGAGAGSDASQQYSNGTGGGASLSLPQETVGAPVAVVPISDGTGAVVAVFPRRSGQPVCDFYAKTGHCRFGEACKFDHPLEYAVKLSSKGLPLRPGVSICAYYEKSGGECKFGAACKFHHPDSLVLSRK